MPTKKPSPRLERVSDLILQALATVLRKEVHDPRLAQATLTGAHLSPDLKHAKIFFTTLAQGKEKEIEKVFVKASGYLRHLLAGATHLRHIPKLHFVYDESVERGAKLSALIDHAIKADEKLQQEGQNRSDDDTHSTGD